MKQILEDMLRACVLKYGTEWEKSLTHAEFTYNNSYQANLRRSPFEALYGRKCCTPLMWSEVGERSFFSLAKIQEADKGVAQVWENLKIAQSQQKRYVDTRRRDLQFEIGNYVYLKVSRYEVPSDYKWKGNWHRDMWGRIEFAEGLVCWPTSWNY